MQMFHDTAVKRTVCTWRALSIPRGGSRGRGGGQEAKSSRLLSSCALPEEPEHTADGPLPRSRGSIPWPSPASRNILPSTSRHSSNYAFGHMDTSATRRPQQSQACALPPRTVNAKVSDSSSSGYRVRSWSPKEPQAEVVGEVGDREAACSSLLSRAFREPAWSTPWGSQTCRGSCTSGAARSWS